MRVVHRLSFILPLADVAINQIAHEELKEGPRWKTAGYQ